MKTGCNTACFFLQDANKTMGGHKSISSSSYPQHIPPVPYTPLPIVTANVQGEWTYVYIRFPVSMNTIIIPPFDQCRIWTPGDGEHMIYLQEWTSENEIFGVRFEIIPMPPLTTFRYYPNSHNFKTLLNAEYTSFFEVEISPEPLLLLNKIKITRIPD